MEAHARLKKKGFNVRSFGTGDKIKLPGPSANQPNVYDFGTTYEEIHADLARWVNRFANKISPNAFFPRSLHELQLMRYVFVEIIDDKK